MEERGAGQISVISSFGSILGTRRNRRLVAPEISAIEKESPPPYNSQAPK